MNTCVFQPFFTYFNTFNRPGLILELRDCQTASSEIWFSIDTFTFSQSTFEAVVVPIVEWSIEVWKVILLGALLVHPIMQIQYSLTYLYRVCPKAGQTTKGESSKRQSTVTDIREDGWASRIINHLALWEASERVLGPVDVGYGHIESHLAIQ